MQALRDGELIPGLTSLVGWPGTGALVRSPLISKDRVTGPAQLRQKGIRLIKLSLTQFNSLDFKCVSTQCPKLMGI